VRKEGIDIPDAELEVLGALWRIGGGTVRDVLADLEEQGRTPAYTTVHTLLARLERRGYVGLRKEGAANVYRPRISRERVTSGRVGDLVRHLTEGEAVPLILKLVEAHNLSAEDLRELRRHLAGLEEEARRHGER
jgi:predicted transcriptional regulator